MQTLDKHPVLTTASIQALIVAGINLAVSFGWVTISSDQLASINGFLALALPFVMAILIRNKVIAAASTAE